MKLESKKRVNGKTTRIYGIAKTPYQRVIESKHISKDTKQKLQKEYSNLNPVKLQRDLKTKLRNVEKVMRNSNNVKSGNNLNVV